MKSQSIFTVIFFSSMPFILSGFFNGITKSFYADNQPVMKVLTACFLAASALMVLAQRVIKDRHYFPAAVLMVFTILALPVFFISAENYETLVGSNIILHLMFSKPQVIVYGGMVIMSAMLPLFKIAPFTEYFARRMTPEAFHGTKLFKTINLYISLFWGFLFALSMGAQFLPWQRAQIALPIIFQIGIGLPATRFIIPFLQGKLAPIQGNEPRDYLKKAYDAISGMQYVFNKKAAQGVNMIFQFEIHGREEFQGYLEVKDRKCLYHNGRHSSPGLIISADADIWLKIARGEIKGADAFIKKLYTVQGDLSNLALFSILFGSGTDGNPEKNESQHAIELKGFFGRDTVYSTIEPGSIKKVLVLHGSPRNIGTSKTEILTRAFSDGCIEAGAEVETIYLKDKKISHCTGCFTCWTKTPGTCIFRDDVTEIMKKHQEADLVVFASPLYHFGIISILKKYMERTLPMLKPDLVDGRNGNTAHPLRDGFKPTSAVVIGVCGFPEADHFRAFSMNFHLMAETGSGMKILGELYRPGSEILNNPFFTGETTRVLHAAKQAGMEAVATGKINKSLMAEIAEMKVARSEFIGNANAAWAQCIAEGKTMPQLQDEFIKSLIKTAS